MTELYSDCRGLYRLGRLTWRYSRRVTNVCPIDLYRFMGYLSVYDMAGCLDAVQRVAA
jgi:hypothetical protein